MTASVIVVDTSALMAVLLNEPEADGAMVALSEAQEVMIGAPTLFELRLVALKRIGKGSTLAIDALLEELRVRIVPFEEAHAMLAFDALERFRGPPARLNYGDCMNYAIAKRVDAHLLFKGGDFTHTDLRAAPIDG